jgi:hypothetical protein
MVNYCFVIPILEGLVELVKEFSQENTHTTEHDEFYQIARVSREQAWIQLSPTISGMPDFEAIRQFAIKNLIILLLVSGICVSR